MIYLILANSNRTYRYYISFFFGNYLAFSQPSPSLAVRGGRKTDTQSKALSTVPDQHGVIKKAVTWPSSHVATICMADLYAAVSSAQNCTHSKREHTNSSK